MTMAAIRFKIAVLGASGHIGSAVAAEAVSRGHSVTAVARDRHKLRPARRSCQRAHAAADALDRQSLAATVIGHDAVIAALAGRRAGEERTVPEATRLLLEVLPACNVDRLVFVGGGGSLETPPGKWIVDGAHFPSAYKQEALAAAEALDIFRGSAPTSQRWSYLSPPPMHLTDGARTGGFRARATDEPIVDAAGVSRLSVADLPTLRSTPRTRRLRRTAVLRSLLISPVPTHRRCSRNRSDCDTGPM